MTPAKLREEETTTPSSVFPAAETTNPHDTSGAALYNALWACRAVNVAVPGPFNVTKPDELSIVATEVVPLSYVIVPLLILVAVIVKASSVTFLERLVGNPVKLTFARDTVNTVVIDVGE